MENTLAFALISALLYLAGAIPYVIGIVRWEVLPHPFSQGVWFILVGINCMILVQGNTGWSILPAAIQLFFMLVYLAGWCIAFKKIKINWFDYLCLSLAIVALLVWWKAGDNYAAIMTVVVDMIAFLPTIKKGWIQPHSEYIWPWFAAAIFPMFLVLSLQEYTFATVLFWGYLFFGNGLFAIVLWQRQKLLLKES